MSQTFKLLYGLSAATLMAIAGVAMMIGASSATVTHLLLMAVVLSVWEVTKHLEMRDE